MPGRRTHDRLLLIAAPAAAILSMQYVEVLERTIVPRPIDALAVGAGVLAGIVLTPDLDLVEAQRGRKPSLWEIYWIPYGFVMPHRSFASHCPGIGTALRVLWIGWPLALAAWRLGWEIQIPWFVFGGLCLADVIHVTADLTVSWIKKVLRRW